MFLTSPFTPPGLLPTLQPHDKTPKTAPGLLPSTPTGVAPPRNARIMWIMFLWKLELLPGSHFKPFLSWTWGLLIPWIVLLQSAEGLCSRADGWGEFGFILPPGVKEKIPHGNGPKGGSPLGAAWAFQDHGIAAAPMGSSFHISTLLKVAAQPWQFQKDLWRIGEILIQEQKGLYNPSFINYLLYK